MRVVVFGLAVLCWLVSTAHQASLAQTYGPSDPIASVDGEPIFLGQLNLLLVEKLRARDLDRVSTPVQQASSALLVRQHLAMRTLRERGGDGLQGLLDREWKSYQEQLTLTGKRMDDYCRSRKTTPQSVRRLRDWESGWKSYLKSKMTDNNLERFYLSNRDRYASAKWDVSHLVITVDASEPNAREIAEQRMEAIVTRLQSVGAGSGALVKTFADLARRESDGSTASSGGALGWVSETGDLPKAVVAAIRQTKPGAVTSVVKSPLGLHLVLVHEKSVEDTSFDQLVDQGQLRRDAADTMFSALVAAQKNAKIVWFIKALKPPEGTLLK